MLERVRGLPAPGISRLARLAYGEGIDPLDSLDEVMRVTFEPLSELVIARNHPNETEGGEYGTEHYQS